MFPGAGALLALPLLALWLASLARERAWLVYGVVVLVAFVFAVATSRGKRFLALRAWLLLAAVVLGVAFGWFAVGVAFGVFAAAIFAVLAWGRLQRARALPLAAASEGTGIQR